MAQQNGLTDVVSQAHAYGQEYLVKKAPFTLPPGVVNFIVAIAPWLTLLGVIVVIPSLLAVLGLGTLLAPFTRLHYGPLFYLSTLIAIIGAVFEALAIPGLFKRSHKGWDYLFYAYLLTIVGNVLSLSIMGLVSTLIGLYFLFQVEKAYK